MSTYAAAKLVAAREIKVKLRDKTFIFSTIFFLLFAVAATALPALLSGGSSSVAVVGQAAVQPLRDAGLEVTTAADDATAERLVRDGDVDAAVVSTGEVVGLEDVPGDVMNALSQQPTERILDPSAVDPFLAFAVPFGLAFVFFFTSFLFGLSIAQSVTEEKQTRIVEILVSSVPTRALLAGKVAALTLLAFAQVTLIAIVTLVGARLADLDNGMLSLLQPAIGWFLAFFVLGFIMLATLWAGVGALSARQEDINGVSQPVQMAVMLPFFAVIFFQDNDQLMRILSYVPFTAPVAMPLRLFNGDTSAWEPYVALVILAISAAVLLVAGARLYEGSVLRTNGRTSWSQAWKSRAKV